MATDILERSFRFMNKVLAHTDKTFLYKRADETTSVEGQLLDKLIELSKAYELIVVFTPISDKIRIRRIVPDDCEIVTSNAQVVDWIDPNGIRRRVSLINTRDRLSIGGMSTDCIVMHCEQIHFRFFPIEPFLDEIAPKLVSDTTDLVVFISEANYVRVKEEADK